MVTSVGAQPPFRFLDGQGFAWTVLELRAHGAGGSLYFFSRGSTLRLSSYPADWAGMDWEGLEELRLRAEVLSEDVTRRSGRSRRLVTERVSPT